MDGTTEPPEERLPAAPEVPVTTTIPDAIAPQEATPEPLRAGAFSCALAGLQAGMVGVCWMLAWLGVSAVWQRRSFWTAANLMATAFYGERAIRAGFATRT